MSLFFLILTVVTFFLSHYCSRRTKPSAEFDYNKSESFESDLEDWHARVEAWAKSQLDLIVSQPKADCFIITEKPRLFSFGHFCHLHTKVEGTQVKVHLFIQPKLLSSSRHKKLLSQKLRDEFQLKNVS